MTEELLRMLNTDIEFIRFTASDVIATSDIPGGGGGGDHDPEQPPVVDPTDPTEKPLGVFSEAGSDLTDGYTTKVNGFRFGFGSKQ